MMHLTSDLRATFWSSLQLSPSSFHRQPFSSLAVCLTSKIDPSAMAAAPNLVGSISPGLALAVLSGVSYIFLLRFDRGI